MTFSDYNAHSDPLFKNLKILKVKDNLFLQNCLFVYDYFHGNLPNSFIDTFTKIDNTHRIETRNATDGFLVKSMYNLTKYGLKSIYNLCINSWNKFISIQKNNDEIILKNDKQHTPTNLYNITRSKLKILITKFFLDSY